MKKLEVKNYYNGIVESWENKDEIKEEIIIKLFLTCGIKNNTDCSEDYLLQDGIN